MRQKLRFLSVILPFAVSSLVAACRLPEVDARQRLEADGLTEILLVKTEAGFEWTALARDGQRCRGTVTVASEQASGWSVARTCAQPG
ncbi:MAG: hypothetical protein FJ095_03395 [Deltaproteobacteria bacterium]|nr:hypothetical protein [Deltaproteobacteria bacterium]